MEKKVITYEDLEVWKKVHQLVLDIYKTNGEISTGRKIWHYKSIA